MDNETGELTGDQLARVAYDAYGTVTDHKNFQGNPMPEYDDLTPLIKTAWEAVALAIWDVFLTESSSES